MILWSIQHRIAYDKMLETGSLRADTDYLLSDRLFSKDAYTWLAEQMKDRVGMPPEGVRFPVWAWYQWEGVRKRPDMRFHRHFSPKGSPIVLLTIDVPDEQVLLSDFDMWHCVLNNYQLFLYGEDIEDPTQEQIEQSWTNVFRWDVVVPDWPAPKSTQATFWEIKTKWVKKAEFFTSL